MVVVIQRLGYYGQPTGESVSLLDTPTINSVPVSPGVKALYEQGIRTPEYQQIESQIRTNGGSGAITAPAANGGIDYNALWQGFINQLTGGLTGIIPDWFFKTPGEVFNIPQPPSLTPPPTTPPPTTNGGGGWYDYFDNILGGYLPGGQPPAGIDNLKKSLTTGLLIVGGLVAAYFVLRRR